MCQGGRLHAAARAPCLDRLFGDGGRGCEGRSWLRRLTTWRVVVVVPRRAQIERLHDAGERSGLATAVMEHANALCNLASALLVTKRLNEAEACYVRALEVSKWPPGRARRHVARRRRRLRHANAAARAGLTLELWSTCARACHMASSWARVSARCPPLHRALQVFELVEDVDKVVKTLVNLANLKELHARGKHEARQQALAYRQRLLDFMQSHGVRRFETACSICLSPLDMRVSCWGAFLHAHAGRRARERWGADLGPVRGAAARLHDKCRR